MNRIDGKYALITGGTQGLGAAITRRLAENGAAGIITIGRSEEKGKEVAKKITDDTDLVISDCVMAGNHVAHIASQDIDSIHPISLVKMAYGLQII